MDNINNCFTYKKEDDMLMSLHGRSVLYDQMRDHVLLLPPFQDQQTIEM